MPTPPLTAPIGGIDIGGTKIEARLFDGPQVIPRATRRIATPRGSYAELLAALNAQIDWLEAQAHGPLPVGVAIPGQIDPDSGTSFAANIPTTGHSPARDLAATRGRRVPVVNDAMAFALSEAVGGAGDGSTSVMGLILGTGVGGGICLDGALPPRHAGLSVEVGHIGLPARALAAHGLPLFPCGCGKAGCIETYVSGTGMANIAQALTGTRTRAEDGPDAATLAAWTTCAGEALAAIQILLDPACIVLGGGLSRMEGIAARLTDALAAARLGDARLPAIRVAQHGDASGARGAALVARC